ncbi:MAG: type VI lipase adapter Tla3 domain-containing protein [Stenotrophomonas sp.]|uniref:type VI lipase adapter Tla3 domain-containing protein n=1 Tax=Stenotrophomonas sp. TaxID=69392 RepID=UPI003D6C7CB2
MGTPPDSDTTLNELEKGYMRTAIGWGIGGISVLVALVFGGHWGLKALSRQSGEAPSAVAGNTPLHEQQDESTWSLELRGVGFAPGPHHQVSVWKKIQEKRDNFASIYSQDPNDYPDSAQSRQVYAGTRTGSAFRYAAGDAVAYWPIPTFAIEPPNLAKRDYMRAADLIDTGRFKGSLGVTLFLWQQDANVAHAQPMIEQLFELFDTQTELPLAMIASRDGDVTRQPYAPPGTPPLSDEHFVPVVEDTTATLLVARTDRVDRYLRPFAPNYAEDNQDNRTDLGKLWSFFFENKTKAMDHYEEEARKAGATDPIAPGTTPTSYWQAALPALWATTDNRGPGEFKPTPWLPIRWAKHQVEEFDRAPHLGHLHRPIKVMLRDAEGKPLKPALQTQAMLEGWQRALATLPEGSVPSRVFYDSHDGTALNVALNNALHALNTDGHGLELGNVDEGYDIGRRIANVGVTSPLVQIGLGAVASYHEGGVSAVVYAGDDGSATIQMVRPPSAEDKAKNNPPGVNLDPFKRRVRGG